MFHYERVPHPHATLVVKKPQHLQHQQQLDRLHQWSSAVPVLSCIRRAPDPEYPWEEPLSEATRQQNLPTILGKDSFNNNGVRLPKCKVLGSSPNAPILSLAAGILEQNTSLTNPNLLLKIQSLWMKTAPSIVCCLSFCIAVF